MPGPSPAGPLMREHRVIERMIAVLDGQLEAMMRRGAANPRAVDVAIDFIRTYADACHHGKEENILFRRLAAKELDLPVDQMVKGLIQDHVYGREMTRGLIEANNRYAAGDASALGDIESRLRALIHFYPAHIDKEDRHFFKPALECFSDREQAVMLRDFDDFDRTVIHSRYLRVVEELEAAARG